MIGNFRVMAEEEMNKAFRYYNYVREFYGYLCDSLDLVFEDDCGEFDPSYAPAEKEFAPAEGNDDSLTPKAKMLDKISRAIRAYETMQSIIAILDKDGVEEAARKRGMMQDTHKFALTSIAEWFPMPSIWREFDMYSNNQLDKYANDAQSAVALMDPLLLEESIHKVFEKQKECLEKFLPQKIEMLKELKAKMESSYKGKMDWSRHLHKGELALLAARPGVGIKTFALNIAENVALDEGKGVVYLDLDDSYAERTEQLLCQRANIDNRKIYEDSLDNAEMKMLLTAVGEIMHSHLRIENATDLTLTELAQKARLYKQLKSLDVLIVDCLHLLKVQSGADRADNLKLATWALKNLASELNISILLLCPLSRRASNDKMKPQLSDLTEISDIVQEVDSVWIIDRVFWRTQREEDREKADVTIVRFQENAPKSIPLRFTDKKGFASVES